MARMARIVVLHYPHHVTQCGNRRQKTFFSEDDYRYYIGLVSESAKRSETEVLAYCLMPNHVHFIMVPSSEGGLRNTFGEAHRHYTRHINFRHAWRGHLWQERFHSFVTDENHLMAAARYVELNPVVARFCNKPEEWLWSSTRAHINGHDDDLVSVRPMLDIVPDWRAYFSENLDLTHNESIERHTRTGKPLGSAGLVKELEHITGRVFLPQKPRTKNRVC